MKASNAVSEWADYDFKSKGYQQVRRSSSEFHDSDVSLKDCPCTKCEYELERRPNWYLNTQELKKYYGQESEEESEEEVEEPKEEKEGSQK